MGSTAEAISEVISGTDANSILREYFVFFWQREKQISQHING